jgi:hypothetical protein
VPDKFSIAIRIAGLQAGFNVMVTGYYDDAIGRRLRSAKCVNQIEKGRVSIAIVFFGNVAGYYDRIHNTILTTEALAQALQGVAKEALPRRAIGGGNQVNLVALQELAISLRN